MFYNSRCAFVQVSKKKADGRILIQKTFNKIESTINVDTSVQKFSKATRIGSLDITKVADVNIQSGMYVLFKLLFHIYTNYNINM